LTGHTAPTAQRPSPVLLMSEAQLQTNILDAAKTLGWLPYHTYLSKRSQPGFPDLVLLHERQSRAVFSELKRERATQTPEQLEWERVLRSLPLIEFYLWRPRHWFDQTILKTLQRQPT
jgi:hypothetical protein